MDALYFCLLTSSVFLIIRIGPMRNIIAKNSAAAEYAIHCHFIRTHVVVWYDIPFQKRSPIPPSVRFVGLFLAKLFFHALC
jgi:hypothetical protein